MKKLRVTVEGKVYEVLVEVLDEGAATSAPVARPEAPALTPAPLSAAPITPPAPVPRPAPAATAGANDVSCPLSGKLVSIDVKIGQAVAEGAQVATIEAMKMNTYIYAPKSGSVAEILATPGDGVEEGAVLLRLA